MKTLDYHLGVLTGFLSPYLPGNAELKDSLLTVSIALNIAREVSEEEPSPLVEQKTREAAKALKEEIQPVTATLADIIPLESQWTLADLEGVIFRRASRYRFTLKAALSDVAHRFDGVTTYCLLAELAANENRLWRYPRFGAGTMEELKESIKEMVNG